MENHEASATQEPQGSRTALTAHTPGPWKWHWRSEDGLATGSVFAEPRKGHAYAVAICPRYQKQPQWEADARLIAAAPDMLDALQSILSHIEPQPSALAKAIATTCRSAIAKATEPK